LRDEELREQVATTFAVFPDQLSRIAQEHQREFEAVRQEMGNDRLILVQGAASLLTVEDFDLLRRDIIWHFESGRPEAAWRSLTTLQSRSDAQLADLLTTLGAELFPTGPPDSDAPIARCQLCQLGERRCVCLRCARRIVTSEPTIDSRGPCDLCGLDCELRLDGNRLCSRCINTIRTFAQRETGETNESSI
jgi:hypothetical protein